MPGAWTLSLNRTDSNLRWILDNTTMNFVSGSGNADTNLTLNKWVEIAGNLFRDINNDDAWSYAEGIEGANVTVSSSTYGPVDLTSDILGTWRVFVPVNDTYDVFATKDGYSNGSASIQVDYTANTSDIEMMAGIVTVGGEISHVLPSEWSIIADDITLALIPTSGLTFDEVTPTKVLVNGTWDGTWTADVEPGDWLLYATYDGNEGRFAAMEHVTAAVAEGGETDAMLSTASVLHVSTKWVDFDGDEFTLGDSSEIDSGDNLVFASGMMHSWNQTVDSNGQISLLLPAGDYSISGTFVTTQLGVEMTYNGGKNAEVVGGGVESPDQLVMFDVQADHSITFSVGENHTSIEQSDEDGDNFTIINNDAEDGDDYTAGEINMQLTYTGNMAEDEYMLTFELNGGDAQYWTVEVWTGTNETGDDIWSEYHTYRLGLQSNATEDIRIRVTAANESFAESYDEGHSLLVKMTHNDQSFNEYELKMFIPQEHGIGLDESQIPEVIGVQPGNDETFAFMFENTGNGDDTFSISISELDESLTPWWSVTGASSVTVGPRTSQAYSVNIHASEIWVEDTEFTVTVTITSEDNSTQEVVSLNIKTALPDLAFTGDPGMIGLSQDGFAPMGQTNQLFVNVINTGLVDARNVQVEVLDESDVVVGSLTLDVPADNPYTDDAEITTFTIDIEPVSDIGSVDYTFKINTTGLELVDDNPDVIQKSINYQPPVSTKANSWVGLIVGLIIAGLIGLFWKFSGRRGSQAF